MCQAICELREESELRDRLMQAQKCAKNLYDMGFDTEKISPAVGCAIETVKEWLGLEA